MDTSSINRPGLPPATAAPAGPAAVPAAASAPAVAADPAKPKDATTPRAPTKEEIKNSVDAINRFLQDNSEVRFSIDEDSGRSVVKVVDTETKKVLRQFPSEQSLEIGKNLGNLKGMLIDSEA
ncbi:flagellar protein FlaG [Duganella sp. BuS-21]|uniref:flagellar protein FlaG n=1 Tax=Duganella sp. BuS-21 TaxID=2943848 RepID=UPI0035A67D8E